MDPSFALLGSYPTMAPIGGTLESCAVHLKHRLSCTDEYINCYQGSTMAAPLPQPEDGSWPQPPPWPPNMEPPPPWAAHMQHHLVRGPVWRAPNWGTDDPPPPPPTQSISQALFHPFPEGCGASPSACSSGDPYVPALHSPTLSPSTTTIEWPW